MLLGMGVIEHALDFDALPMHEIFSDTPLDQSPLGQLLGDHDRLISCFAGGDRKAELRLGAMCNCECAAFLPVRPPACYPCLLSAGRQAQGGRPEDSRGHLLDLWSDMLGLHPRDLATLPTWEVPEQWVREASNLLTQQEVDPSGQYIVIHPGAGAEAKRWGIEQYEQLAERVDCPVFVLGPVEVERWSEQEIANLRERFPTLIHPELETLAGLLVGASGYVGNDSGVSHLAGAVGAPAVVLFAPRSSANHFAPVGRNVRVLSAGRMDDITPERVLKALMHLRG